MFAAGRPDVVFNTHQRAGAAVMSATPGPWEYRLPLDDETDEDGNKYWEVRPETFHTGREYLCISSWMSEANASLIAAAPDLLLAVKCLCEEMADYMAINKLGDPNDKHNYRLGMAAIAKAEATPTDAERLRIEERRDEGQFGVGA